LALTDEGNIVLLDYPSTLLEISAQGQVLRASPILPRDALSGGVLYYGAGAVVFNRRWIGEFGHTVFAYDLPPP
jgi:hypothetical protein